MSRIASAGSIGHVIFRNMNYIFKNKLSYLI